MMHKYSEYLLCFLMFLHKLVQLVVFQRDVKHLGTIRSAAHPEQLVIFELRQLGTKSQIRVDKHAISAIVVQLVEWKT